MDSIYSRVLSLARMGALDQAEALYAKYQLDQKNDDEDSLALRARLLKDRARLLSGAPRQQKLHQAAEAYLHSHRQTDGSFSAINAATLFLLSGSKDKAAALAEWCLAQDPPKANQQNTQHQASLQNADHRLPPGEVTLKAQNKEVEARYFYFATKAEALLVLCRQEDSQRAMKAAIAKDPDNWLHHAITLRQLTMLNSFHSLDASWLESFRPPSTCHYAGSIQAFSGTDKSDDVFKKDFNQRLFEWENALRPIDYIHPNAIGEAYGALAVGIDILLAEYFLENNIHLHVILPCPPDEFCKFSVSPYGKDWENRFQQCLNNAASLMLATQDTALTCKAAVDLATIIAMGKAKERADLFATTPQQLTISSSRTAGDYTKPHIDAWRATHAHSHHICITPETPNSNQGHSIKTSNRILAAMLFVDVTGFGILNDHQVMQFLDVVMTPLRQVIDQASKPALHKASWGDGIFLVFDDPVIAAHLSLKLQAVFSDLDLVRHGLPDHLQLRIGGHYGPVTLRPDPITQRLSAYGSQVTYAARIEPDTLPGSVFISEAFAAALRLFGETRFITHFTGNRVLRKNTPPIRLFNLAAKA